MMMDTIISEKYHNYDYAPGIPTYGIDGKDGKSGMNGISLFVCQHDITNDVGLGEFGKAILQNLDMSLGGAVKINRDYIEGDSFLFTNCEIWKIKDIVELKKIAAINQLTTDNFSQYLERVGRINMTTTTDGIITNGDRLLLDNTRYKGFVINNAGLSNNELPDIEAPFTIMSNDTDNDDNIQFIDLKSIFSNATDSELKIYYDTNTKAYHIYSDKPILFDCDLKVSNTTSDEFDEYSAIITKENNITSFIAFCNGDTDTDGIRYDISVNSYVQKTNLDVVALDIVDDGYTEVDTLDDGDGGDTDDGDAEDEVVEDDNEITMYKIDVVLTDVADNNYDDINVHFQGIQNHKVVFEMFVPFSSFSTPPSDNYARTFSYDTEVDLSMVSEWKVSFIDTVEIFIKQKD